MFFKGTEDRLIARDIAGDTDSIGAEFNAFMGKEYTGYYVKCAAEHRDTALDVLVDMLRHSKFDAEEIEREKGVIVEEMNMAYDTPRDYVDGVYDSLLYGDEPLGWDIIGTKETVRGATRETFTDYLDRWHRAPRMVAGFAGAVGGDAADGSPRCSATSPTAPPARPSWSVGTGRAARQAAHEDLRPGPHPHGRLSYPLGHADRYPLMLLATVLGGGMSSRLFTEVRERRGLADYIDGYNQAYTDAGTLFAEGGVDIQRIDEAVKTVIR